LLTSGERFTLGRNYFFSLLRWRFSAFLSATVSYIGNWGDGSYLLSPMIQYDISPHIKVSSGFYFPGGKNDVEFTASQSSIFFAWLRIDF
jgi:hypothetical protein